jgi:hypothetical protein
MRGLAPVVVAMILLAACGGGGETSAETSPPDTTTTSVPQDPADVPADPSAGCGAAPVVAPGETQETAARRCPWSSTSTA